MRNVGRLISDVRDAEVRLQTIRQLQGLSRNRRQRKYSKVEEMLALELENFVAAFAEWQSQAIPLLEDITAGIESWPVDQFDCEQLRRAIQRSYKSSRKALAEAKASRTARSFHEFRSATKQLGYQLRIVRPVNAVVHANFGKDLGVLGDLLGRAHDLGFLGDRLRQERGHSQLERESHELLAVIEASATDLQRGAADLAERFFAERPRDFGRRLSARLEEWSDAKSQSVAQALVEDAGTRAAVA